MKDFIKILLILLLSYQVYILLHNIVLNALTLLEGGTPFLYYFGFICTVDQSFLTIVYYSILLLIKVAVFASVPVFKIHLSKNRVLQVFGALLIVLFSFEVLNFIAYAIDLQFGTFYRSYFFVSSHLYALSLALSLPVLTIPVVFLGLVFYLLYPLLKITKTKDLILLFTLSFLSVLGYALIFENILLQS